MSMKMNRLFCTIALTGFFILLQWQQSIAQQTAVKPNIIFILADDLGYGDLGCYGQKLIQTPNLDAMAKQGTRFTQFYAGTAVCAPSRSSFLTGQHTGHTPIRGNKGVQPEGQWPIPDSAVTIAEVLKKAGYATGDFGKWGLGPVASSGDPIKQGFDAFYGYNCQTLAHDYYPDHLWENDTRIDFAANTPEHPTDYSADLIHQKALQFIDQHKGNPFFVFLSYTLPHAALQVPDDSLFEKYKKLLNEKPIPVPKWNGKNYAPQAYPRAAYAAMVSRLDVYVGQVLQKLKEAGIDKNTLVIFSSDNGPHKEGGYDPDYFNSNGPLRGIKRDLYEGGMREPMIAWWPGKIKAGATSDYVGAFWDFLPTFAELAKALKPANIDGISIVPALLGQKNAPSHPWLYWEFHEQGGKQAVRMGKWKGIKLNVTSQPNGPIELYDLTTDLGEKNNVADKHPDIVQEIKKIMEQQHRESPDFPLFTKSANTE
ncbi:arylsulfatase [Niastella koreensis]|uniref:Cerebroside-sulfatase n=3 Tax=Niastella koreensis TaxID=354356 RepID=G8TLM0_NIAKG|nr:Cerebroside-sulfatase [Niastella koreensis GR20-10]OQP54104.1 arylsulfatase [Niastella koreensis]